jgi:hypothetical protein
MKGSIKVTTGGIGWGTVVFIVLIVVALVTGGPIWGTSWGWFIFQSFLIWVGISVVIPLILIGVVFLITLICEIMR